MKRLFAAISAAIVLVSFYLMTLPTGIKMTSSDGIRLYVHYYPYYSPAIMFAAGNYLPILMMILSASAFILLVIRIIRPASSAKRSLYAVRCLGVAVVCSLISSFTVLNTMTVLSNIITALILLAAVLERYSYKKYDRHEATHADQETTAPGT